MSWGVEVEWLVLCSAALPSRRTAWNEVMQAMSKCTASCALLPHGRYRHSCLPSSPATTARWAGGWRAGICTTTCTAWSTPPSAARARARCKPPAATGASRATTCSMCTCPGCCRRYCRSCAASTLSGSPRCALGLCKQTSCWSLSHAVHASECKILCSGCTWPGCCILCSFSLASIVRKPQRNVWYPALYVASYGNTDLFHEHSF